MSKLNNPSLLSYQKIINEILQYNGPSLFTLQSNPRENIYPLCYNCPLEFNTGKLSNQMVVRQLQHDQNANIRALVYLVLHRCFYSSSVKAFGELLQTILDEKFIIKFPNIDINADPSLFNNLQFKKLLMQYLTMVDSHRFSIEQGINRYPIIDVIFFHIVRTIANNHSQYSYAEQIPTNKLLKYFHQAFGLRVIDHQGNLYTFEDNSLLLDNKNIYICYPHDSSTLEISKVVDSQHTLINIFGDCIKDSVIMKESQVVPDFIHKMKQSEMINTAFFSLDGLINNDYGKVASSQIFSSRLQKPNHQTLDNKNLMSSRQPFHNQSVTRSNIFMQQKVGPRSSSFSVPKGAFVGNVKDQIRKSQMRMSVMKNKQDLKNKKVSTIDIFNNDDYFAGRNTNKSQILASNSRKPNIVSSATSPFQEIMKNNYLIQKSNILTNSFQQPTHNTTPSSLYNYTYKSTKSYNETAPISVLPEKSRQSISAEYGDLMNNSYQISTHSNSQLNSSNLPQVTSTFNISADRKSNVIKVEINQPICGIASLESHYGDFTNSHILDYLPTNNKKSIEGIKNSLKMDTNKY